MLVLTATISIFAVAGGWIGWLLGTRAMYKRSHDALEPVFSDRLSDPKVFARRQRQRVATSGAYALLAACAGLGTLLILVR